MGSRMIALSLRAKVYSYYSIQRIEKLQVLPAISSWSNAWDCSLQKYSQLERRVLNNTMDSILILTYHPFLYMHLLDLYMSKRILQNHHINTWCYLGKGDLNN